MANKGGGNPLISLLSAPLVPRESSPTNGRGGESGGADGLNMDSSETSEDRLPFTREGINGTLGSEGLAEEDVRPTRGGQMGLSEEG